MYCWHEHKSFVEKHKRISIIIYFKNLKRLFFLNGVTFPVDICFSNTNSFSIIGIGCAPSLMIAFTILFYDPVYSLFLCQYPLWFLFAWTLDNLFYIIINYVFVLMVREPSLWKVIELTILSFFLSSNTSKRKKSAISYG